MAPNVFHIGVRERVSVTVFDAGQPVTVKLYLQDYPHRRKTFSAVQGVVNKGELKEKMVVKIALYTHKKRTLPEQSHCQCS